MNDEITICPTHRTYHGKRKPRTDCAICLEIYTKNKGKIMEEKPIVDQDKLAEKAIQSFTESPPDVETHVLNPPETVTMSGPSVEITTIDPPAKTINAVPPHDLKRNEFGLLPNINYVFDENGMVNWKAMLRPQDLALNRLKKDEIEKKYGKSFSELDVIKEGVEDKYVVLLLAGIRYLAMVRGFTECTFSGNSSEDRADVRCTMIFVGNYETNNKEVRFESFAERSKSTTIPPFSNFLVSLAENAAFVRTVRNFLRIPIVAYDEIIGSKDNGHSTDDSDISPTSPQYALKTQLDKYKITFEILKKGAIAAKNEENLPKYPEAEKWTSVKDVAPLQCLSLITSIKKLKDKDKKAE